MNKQEAKQEIIKRTIVSEQNIIIAKAYIISLSHNEQYDTKEVANKFASEQGRGKPTEIQLRIPESLDASLAQASGYFSDILSFSEAFWLLVYEGVLWASEQSTNIDTNISWTTIIHGSGQRGDIYFEEFSSKIPNNFVFAPSYRFTDRKTLFDPDLFIIETKLQEFADSEVIEAIQDSINCFRKELYRPAVVLLGKAMEGAWIELGISCANSIPAESGFNKDRFIEAMKDDSSIMKKIEKILDLYNKSYTEGIRSNSGIRYQELKSIALWSDILRESRNSIHFGVKPVVPNTYEKVAVLLLAAAEYLPKIYYIKTTADQST
jgi:hypothetical protein